LLVGRAPSATTIPRCFVRIAARFSLLREATFFLSSDWSRRLNLDLPALEHEFHRLSRKLHPDRFARAQENEKEWSLADTALLNDAYRTLKDPLRRTGYLLKLLGAVDPEHQEKSPRTPADLLEEVFELNMQIEEMRANRQTGAVDAELEAALTQAKMKTEALLSAVDEDLRDAWSAWDAGDVMPSGKLRKKEWQRCWTGGAT
jgi:molecular chaperone HscB